MPVLNREQILASQVTVWTDGSIYMRHPIQPGGWAYIVVDRGEVVAKVSGVELLTTGNRMELTAVLRALQVVPSLADISRGVFVYSDSQYVVRGATEWLDNWKYYGWVTRTGEPVKNRDLWEGLDEHKARMSIFWHWVRGHTGVEHNELADDMAREQAKGARDAWESTRWATVPVV